MILALGRQSHGWPRDLLALPTWPLCLQGPLLFFCHYGALGIFLRLSQWLNAHFRFLDSRQYSQISFFLECRKGERKIQEEPTVWINTNMIQASSQLPLLLQLCFIVGGYRHLLFQKE